MILDVGIIYSFIKYYWHLMSGIMLGSVDAGINNASPSLVGERHILRQGCHKMLPETFKTLKEWQGGGSGSKDRVEVLLGLQTVSRSLITGLKGRSRG